MKNGLTLFTAITLVTSSFSYATDTDNNDEVTTRLVDEFHTAVPKHRAEPKYPSNAARNGHEGWVKLSFVVDKEGNVIDPFVTDSLGHHSFETAAISAIKKWKYTPALRDGEAIESCQNEVQLSFSIADQKLSRRFYSFYQTTNELLVQNELERAKDKLANSRFLTKSNLLEQSYLSMLWADYYQKTNQPKQQLKHLYNVTSGVKHLYKDNRFDADVHVYNLNERFIAELKTQQFANALDTYDGLAKFETPQAKQILQSLEPYYQQVKALKNSDSMIVHDGVIGDSGRWHHKLHKNGFALAEVDGELSKLNIRCNGHHVTYVPNQDNHWKIPDSWGSCYLFIVGSEGATFKVVETNKT